MIFSVLLFSFLLSEGGYYSSSQNSSSPPTLKNSVGNNLTLTPASENLITDAATEALQDFTKYEKLYNSPDLTKGYYQKWTSEGQQATKDARLLHIGLKKIDEKQKEIVNKSGGDYTDNILTPLTKIDQIKLLLKKFEDIASKTGPDYSDNPLEFQSNETARSCNKNKVVFCEPTERYRKINAQCNNLRKYDWGMSDTTQKRLFPFNITYEDGRGEPALSHPFGGGKRMTLPNPRLVSKRVHENKDRLDIPNKKVTHLYMQFAQFLDHDITLTPEPELECCHKSLRLTTRCFNIDLDYMDMVDMSTEPAHVRSVPAKEQTCIAFSRSDPACDEGTFNGQSIREQINSITAFVDASNVYGSSEKTAKKLRWTVTSEKHLGFLQVHLGNFKDLPPRSQVGVDSNFPPQDKHLKAAGDGRCVEHPGLASMHTLWFNEHNRLAYFLQNENIIKEFIANKTLEERDEFIYQEARRILIAEMQKIVYTEFLPLVLGPRLMEDFNLEITSGKTTYNDSVDPTVVNEFSTVAFRFGHTLVGPTFGATPKRGRVGPGEMKTFSLENVFFDDNLSNCDNATCSANKEVGCTNTTCTYWTENILYGLMNMPAQANDIFMNTHLVNNLFRSKEIRDKIIFDREGKRKKMAETSDLASRNIMRHRDHGLPPYAFFRNNVKFSPLKDLDLFGIKPCEACMQKQQFGDYFCSPLLLPDRECEDCLNYKNYVEMAQKYKELSKEEANPFMPCKYCVKRKCGARCVPNKKVRDKNDCALCYQKQIIALNSCDDVYRANKFVAKKCECKKCADARVNLVKGLDEGELGFKTEDFIRLAEVYCWHVNSINPFSGGLGEISVKDGLQGPTNAAIIADQFKRILDGDRFFFTHAHLDDDFIRGMNRVDIDMIFRQSFASVICNNLQTYRVKAENKFDMKVKVDPFKINSEWKSCTEILNGASIDFERLANRIVSDHKTGCYSGVFGSCKKSTCITDKTCNKKLKNRGDYECMNGVCQLKRTSCFSDADCQNQRICRDSVCIFPFDRNCSVIKCKPNESCNTFKARPYCKPRDTK